MSLEIKYIENIHVYPEIIRDIIEKICLKGKEFDEIRIWYGDGFDHSVFDTDETIFYFNENYLLEENESRAVYIPYDKIYEILIYYK